MKNLKVLLVEDDKMLCTIFEMFLIQMGHDLIGIYQDADTAFEKCKEQKPDLAVLDIHIAGDLDGIQAASIIQDLYDVPIIFLSGDTEEETLLKANDIKCKVFLSKPIYKSTLKIAIEIAYFKYCSIKFETSTFNSDVGKLINNLDEPVLLLRDSLIIKANEPALNYFNFKDEKEISLPFYNFLTEASRHKFKEVFDRLLNLKLLLEYVKLDFEFGEVSKTTVGVSFSFIQNLDENILLLYFDSKT